MKGGMKMKKYLVLAAVFVMLAGGYFADLGNAGLNDRFAGSGMDGTEKYTLEEIADPAATPLSNTGWLYVKDNSGTSDIYFEDDGGTVTELTAAGSTTITDIGDATGDGVIVSGDNEILQMTFADTNEDMLTIDGIGAFADVSVMRVNQITGNPTDGTVLEVVAADANVDPLVVSASTTANALVVGQNTGVVTIAGVAEGTDTLVLTLGDLTLSDGDLNVDGGDVVFAEDVEINGTITMENDATFDNASNNVISFTENSEDLDIAFASNVIDFSTDTGATQWDMYDGVASTLTKAASGGADDFTISVTGIDDSSLILASSGTGADAMQLSTTAGGMDITVAGAGAGEDIDVSADSSINITSTESAADSIVISSSVGGVDISAAGAAAGEDIDIAATGSSVHISATEGAEDAITITASTAVGGIGISSQADIDITTAGAAGEDITITNTGGSIAITATEAAADAMTIGTSAAGGDLNLDSVLGRIEIEAEEDAANALYLIADGGTASTLEIFNDTGTSATEGAAAIQLVADVGGIAVQSGLDGAAITLLADAGTSEQILVHADQGTGAAATTQTDGTIQLLADAGGIALVSTANLADAIRIEANGGASETVAISSVQGTGAASIDIDSTVGGVTIAANAASKDVDIDSVLGSVVIEAEEDAADAIHIISDGGTTSGLILLNDTGTGDESILLDSDAGGITIHADAGSVDIEAVGGSDGDIGITAGDDLIITATGKLRLIGEVLPEADTAITADTLTIGECGKTFFFDADAEFKLTLPAVSTTTEGCEYTFITSDAADGADYTVTTGNTHENIIDGILEVNGAAVACDDEDTISFVTGNSHGDWFTIVTDGISWFVRGQAVTAAKLTCTTT